MRKAPHPRKIDPVQWLRVANERRPKLPETTEWFDGATQPARVGWYERHFTDSTIIQPNQSMQYWDGEFWRNRPDGTAHWRQVGDYPAWRGLAEVSDSSPVGAERKAL